VLLTLEPWQLVVLFAPALLNTWGIWHIFKHTFATQVERAVWLVVCVFLPVFGGIIYLFFGLRRARGKAGPFFVSPNSSANAQLDGAESEQPDQPEQSAQPEQSVQEKQPDKTGQEK